MDDRKYFALIPARAGSKGLPGKNWLEYRGMSLVARAVECATECEQVSDVAISSDDERAAGLADQFGVRLICRDPVAATDLATAADVVSDALSKWPEARDRPAENYIVYLQPTSPLRTAEHLTEAIELMERTLAPSCVSLGANPLAAMKLVTLDAEDRVVSMFGDIKATANRSSIGATYMPNGAIYVFRVGDFLKSGILPITGSAAYFMDPRESIDIDTSFDWDLLQMREVDSSESVSD